MSKKAGAASKAALVEVVDQDQTALGELVVGLGAWIGQLKAWWADIKDTEARAVLQRDAMLALRAPRTADEDVAIQERIKATNQAKKAWLEKWAVASVVHQIHRRMTARRDATADAYDAGANHANRLHNTYVDDERRKARLEQERLDREAQAKAEADRQKELDRLEAQALKAEKDSPDLSAREELVVVAVLNGMSWKAAAEHAGYRNAVDVAERSSTSKKMVAALDAARAAKSLREQAAAKKAMPVETAPAATVRPSIGKAFGAHDRTTWSVDEDKLDEARLIAAVLGGQLGIPVDVLQINRVKLNEYARSMQTLINTWPGVTAKKTTKVI